MKKLFLATAITASLLSFQSTASGIPTFDAAGLAQAVQQYQQMVEQYAMLQHQYNELVALKNNLSGITSDLSIQDLIGNLSPELQETLNYYSDPSALKNDLDGLIQEKYENAYSEYKNITELGQVIKANSQSRNVAKEQQGVAILEQLSKHQENISQLTNRLKTAQTAKESADITALINAENASINSLVSAQQASQAISDAQAERDNDALLSKYRQDVQESYNREVQGQ